MPFKDLSSLCHDQLIALANDVKTVGPPVVREWTFTSPAPALETVPPVVEELRSWAADSNRFLYVMRAEAPCGESGLLQAFQETKTRMGKARAFCRVNGPGSTLYVGGSQSMHTRMKEHLGYGAARTYSLQLRHWSGPLAMKVTLTCARYPRDTPTQPLQALEDALWDRLTPMFGRRGTR